MSLDDIPVDRLNIVSPDGKKRVWEDNGERYIGLNGDHMLVVDGIARATLFRYGRKGGYYRATPDGGEFIARYPVAEFRSPGAGVVPMWQVGFGVVEKLVLDAEQFDEEEFLALLITRSEGEEGP